LIENHKNTNDEQSNGFYNTKSYSPNTSHEYSMKILTTVSWMFLAFCRIVMGKTSPTSLVEEHKHIKVV
jgi:hypothetical protein